MVFSDFALLFTSQIFNGIQMRSVNNFHFGLLQEHVLGRYCVGKQSTDQTSFVAYSLIFSSKSSHILLSPHPQHNTPNSCVSLWGRCSFFSKHEQHLYGQKAVASSHLFLPLVCFSLTSRCLFCTNSFLLLTSQSIPVQS